MFARKLKVLGKRRSFPSNAGIVTSTTYSGQIRRPGDGNDGNFHVTVVSGKRGKKSLSGSFNFPPFSQNVHEISAGGLSMESFRTAEMPACGGELEPSADHAASNGLAASGSPPIGADGQVTIDVAILLSSEMVTAYGSLDAALAEAANAVAAANTAYSNSQISQELRLVYAGQTNSLQGASMTDDLYRLSDPTDGAFDEAQTLRDTYGADMVSLLWHEDPASSCGIAWVMTSAYIGPSFADSAFSVVMDQCATGNYSFAHELGHNMGAAHNVANAGGQAAYNYSYGYHFTGTNNLHYRTVMAYASNAAGETRVPYFSSPDVQFHGAATGTVNANNALTLNNTAAIVAAFRDTIVGATPTPSNRPAQTPTPEPTISPTPMPTAIAFKNIKASTVGGKCKIAGAVQYDNGNAASSILTKLQRTSGVLVKAAVTSSSGKFSFKTTRNKKYLLVAETLSRSVRCK